LAILYENLEELVENKMEMGLALLDTGAIVENLDTVQVKLAAVGDPVVLTCHVAFLNVGGLGILWNCLPRCSLYWGCLNPIPPPMLAPLLNPGR
jgi:hypothetical protein